MASESKHTTPVPSGLESSDGRVSTGANPKASTGTQTDHKPMFLYEAFFHPLPEFPEAPEWTPNSDTHYSSTNSELTHPPAYWEQVPVSHYLERAAKEMSKLAVKHHLQVHVDSGMDPLMRMRSEADVVRYGNEQLVFHVNHALFSRVGAQIECLRRV